MSLSTGSREEWAAPGHLAPPAALGLDFDKGPAQCPCVSVSTFSFKRQKRVSGRKRIGSCNSKAEAISGRAASWHSAEQESDLSARLCVFLLAETDTGALGLLLTNLSTLLGSFYVSVVPAQVPELVSSDPACGAVLERVIMIRMDVLDVLEMGSHSPLWSPGLGSAHPNDGAWAGNREGLFQRMLCYRKKEDWLLSRSQW